MIVFHENSDALVFSIIKFSREIWPKIKVVNKHIKV